MCSAVAASSRTSTGYLDGFLAVRGVLRVGTFVGDTKWDGGLWVGEAAEGDRLILDDLGFDCDGETRVKSLIDVSETRDPEAVYGDAGGARDYFLACRAAASKP